jgi:hypothetical protein
LSSSSVHSWESPAPEARVLRARFSMPSLSKRHGKGKSGPAKGDKPLISYGINRQLFGWPPRRRRRAASSAPASRACSCRGSTNRKSGITTAPGNRRRRMHDGSAPVSDHGGSRRMRPKTEISVLLPFHCERGRRSVEFGAKAATELAVSSCPSARTVSGPSSVPPP